MKRILSLLLLACLACTAFAATTPNSVVTAQTPNRGIVQFTSASTAGTYLTLYTAGANGSKCYSGLATNTDTVSHLINIVVTNSSVNYVGTAFTLALSAGNTAASPPQTFTSTTVWPGLALDSDGNSYIMLISGDTIRATFATAITASTTVSLYLTCVDF